MSVCSALIKKHFSLKLLDCSRCAVDYIGILFSHISVNLQLVAFGYLKYSNYVLSMLKSLSQIILGESAKYNFTDLSDLI